MVKRLVNGRAAEGGVIGAMLAARGFVGIENVLEAEKGGFYSTFSNGFDLDAAVEGLGSTYFSVNVQPKRYPMITTAHAAIEAACRLVAQEPFRVEEVKEIIVRTNARSQLMTTGFTPETFTAAQMSMAFGVATAIRTGHVLPESLSEAVLKDPELQALMARITPVKEPRFDEIKKEAGGPAQVQVRLTDGRLLESPVIPEISRMTEQEIEDKARHAIGLVLAPKRAEDLVTFLRTLEERPTIDPLFPLLGA
jgi:2-methylcitrate dehydratase PrpD